MCPIARFDGNDDIFYDDLNDSLLGQLFDKMESAAPKKRPSNLASQSNVVPPRELVILDSIASGATEVIQLYFGFHYNSSCSATFQTNVNF